MTDLFDAIKNEKEVVWINPHWESIAPMSSVGNLKFVEVRAAQERFMRFMPFIASAFPETAKQMGVIESKLIPLRSMKEYMKGKGIPVSGKIIMKTDQNLPIAGSVKARGGIHEVLKYAEGIAMKEGNLRNTDSYEILNSPKFKALFSKYTIQVGTTGNLGISIGKTARALGFKTVVHMSREGKKWKKDLLREIGAEIVEYDSDYSEAVRKGREASAADSYSYFIDDENSRDLFMGYATAALRTKVQLYTSKINVSKEHPLFVYLPCGVGGAPGGISFGMRQMFGDHVHCFFAEPTKAPSMLLALNSKDKKNVMDFGLSLDTCADGLAVGKASEFVSEVIGPIVSGCITVTDEAMLEYQRKMWELEEQYLEPSACAGFAGLQRIFSGNEMAEYLKNHDLLPYMEGATHLIWGTGGGLVPADERFC